MSLSKHFTLDEFIHSDTARLRAIDNMPSPEMREEIRLTAEFMEEVRTILGDNPITVTSGYRCPALNKAVGGAERSNHLSGRAVDFICPAFGPPSYVARKIVASSLPYDEVILESFGVSSWVHIARPAVPGSPRLFAATMSEAGTVLSV
jgi:hypothetical protein